MAPGGFVSSPSDNPAPALLYEVSYQTKYGVAPSSSEISALAASSLPTLSYSGYIFLGWFYDETCTKQAEPGDLITETTVLYAGWRRSSGVFDLSSLGLPTGTYTITVKARGSGFADSNESIPITYQVL